MRYRDRLDRGAEAVEFAVIVPVLLLFLTGLITFGIALNAQITISQAARTGARYLAICDTNTDCINGTGTYAGKGYKELTVNAGWGVHIDPTRITDVADCTSGSTATVSVTYVVDLGIPPLSTGLVLTGKASTPCGG